MAGASDLDALIVRNIGDVEAALLHGRKLGDRLLAEIGRAMQATLGDHWHIVVDVNAATPIRIAKRAWLAGDPPLITGYCFTLDQKPGPSGDSEETRLSSLLGTGPAGATMVSYFWSDTFYPKKRWKRFASDHDNIFESLLDAGFLQDTDQWLYIPVLLDAETVAQGYEEGDMTEALKPAVEAMKIILASLPQIEALIEADLTFE